MKLSEIRQEARTDLKGLWIKTAVISFIYLVIFFVISFIQTLFRNNDLIYLLMTIISLVLMIPLAVGLLYTLIKANNKEEIKVFDFITIGFKNFAKFWKISLRMLLKVLPQFILTVIFAVAMVIGYYGLAISGFFLALAFNGVIFTETIKFYLGLLIVGGIGYIVMIFVLLPKFLSFAASYLISYDNPELSPKECVEKSAKLMEGKRWKLFCLYLSFIGWAFILAFIYAVFIQTTPYTIIPTIILYIGTSFLLPYMVMSFIIFYKKTSSSTQEDTVKSE